MEAQAFVAKETGKCSVMVGEEVRGGELGKQVVQYIVGYTSVVGKTVGVWRHVSWCRSISDILHDLLA